MCKLETLRIKKKKVILALHYKDSSKGLITCWLTSGFLYCHLHTAVARAESPEKLPVDLKTIFSVLIQEKTRKISYVLENIWLKWEDVFKIH